MFLPKVYRQWKILFWTMLFFMVSQLYFMWKGIENVPFFLYHMYSRPQYVQDSMAVLLIKKDNQYINPFLKSNRQAEMLLNNIPFYISLKANGYHDPLESTIIKRFQGKTSESVLKKIQQNLSNNGTAVDAFPQWWKAYAENICGSDYDSFSTVISYVSFYPSFSKSPKDSTLFTVYKNK